MQPWQVVAVVCGIAVTVALVLALLSLVRVARRTEAVLTVLEQELRPLVGEAHGLVADLRQLSRQASREVERVGAVTERVGDLAGGVARVVTVVSGFTRAGQIVGLAHGVRKGVDVFIRRFKQGDHHG